jgi:hypothetical protein
MGKGYTPALEACQERIGGTRNQRGLATKITPRILWPCCAFRVTMAVLEVHKHQGESSMRSWSICFGGLAALALCCLPVNAGEKGWVKLFDGKTLEGWEQRNGTAKYRVEEGCIVGTTNKGSPNSFLCSVKEYGDFELKFEVKVDDRLNSGVQIRSKTKGGTKDGRVHGPQVEISTDGFAAYIYGEALGTGWLSGDGKPEKHDNFKKGGQWNTYHVKAIGNRIETLLNGKQIADLTDTKSNMPRGFIGLQVHSIPADAGPYEVRWKNIVLKDLSK